MKYITDEFKALQEETIEGIRLEMIRKYPNFVHDNISAQKRIDKIVNGLKEYFKANRIRTVVLGMSGGLDSTVTAALCAKADVNVIGLVMPIEQKPEETLRGLKTAAQYCSAYAMIDLTANFKILSEKLSKKTYTTTKHHKWTSRSAQLRNINLGNIKARLRMITLYDEARTRDGIVMSTDNYSELLMGFWTLHGDTGDVSPIQMVFKGFELSYIAKELGVLEDIINAVPTDGLGISNSDEDQLGASYRFVDAVMCNHLNYVENRCVLNPKNLDALEIFKQDGKSSWRTAWDIYQAALNIVDRHKRTEFKRNNPYMIEHEDTLFMLRDK
ncbi:NAD(+) synthase [Candidatus Pacearchaeota archaeon]|nr:NAD(+) synthase [Candidatus Pacearchaeota archaeon]|tara:strand:- start:254 stop:1240 length:987 start_codon:yes stop_codon:yes gene_type:complete